MPFCAQCGTQFEGNFCPACGTRAGGTQAGGAQTGGPPPSQSNPFDAPAGGSYSDAPPLDDNVASALCYILWPLTGVMFLVLEPYSSRRPIRFHAYQSVFSFAAFFIGFAALQLFGAIPLLGLIFVFITPIYILIWFAIVLFLAFKAYNKERFLLPIIGPLAEKQA
jgi:uncharacterized membrane protein